MNDEIEIEIEEWYGNDEETRRHAAPQLGWRILMIVACAWLAFRIFN